MAKKYVKLKFTSTELFYRKAIIASIERVLLRTKAGASRWIIKNNDKNVFKRPPTPGKITNRLGVLAASYNEGREYAKYPVEKAIGVDLPYWGKVSSKRLLLNHPKHKTIGGAIRQDQNRVVGTLYTSIKDDSPALKRLNEYYGRRKKQLENPKRAIVERLRHDKKGRPTLSKELDIQVKSFRSLFRESTTDLESVLLEDFDAVFKHL